MPVYCGIVGTEIPKELRLDRYVAEFLGILSRSQIKARNMRASVNGRPVKISRIVCPGDTLNLEWDEPEPADLIPEDIPLTILYEDQRTVVVNKDQGLVVHPGAGNRTGTMANALLFRRLGKGLAGGGIRPGIVHRLDKDTSGVIIAAYDDEALAFLSEQFRSRSVRKSYLAIVQGGLPASSGKIETRISRDPRDRKKFAVSDTAGKQALTFYRVLRSWPGYALVLLRPKTGRTHQLRVHMKYLGCPILGDPLYGKSDRLFPEATLMLHARKLSIRLPFSEEPVVFKAPLPERFKAVIRRLENRISPVLMGRE
ncbi:RluA family pseudouridine synthase [Breznakiella homolactica]|uniref:Pseudouridine synthase n=1 Tax=Breznakiella homolactica TaxID=2798577 RepID=A0A7T7XKU1_9SPIR|nr:RluA family pseudouridine synthase [Breznakiella homolactica]QQO08038.1 RluA family pseudouridine synthase [Breznakiella homolactica]